MARKFLCASAILIFVSLALIWGCGGFARGAIGVVRIRGEIFRSDPIIEELHRYRDNPAVKAIVLELNTPGGSVVASQEIYREVLKAREKKPIVAVMREAAASGGYYIACAANRIVASPGTITGSIGVIAIFPNVEGLFDKIGVKYTVVKSSAFKDIGLPSREMTEEEKAVIQGVVDDDYRQFIKVVAEARNMSEEEVRKLADGRIYTGSQALNLGLVDELGNFQDGLDVAAKLGGIEGKPRILRLERRRFSLFGLLTERIEDWLTIGGRKVIVQYIM
ncbi:MAG: signal peptide peptidase SppA [bacterium]